jgi:hypothetical protein
MGSSLQDFEVCFAGCTLTRGDVVVDGDHLYVRFEMRGPDASVRFPKDHVAVLRGGGTEKLPSLGGYGGEGAHGSFFFEWEMLHEGAEAVLVRYVEGGQVLAHERLLLSP